MDLLDAHEVAAGLNHQRLHLDLGHWRRILLPVAATSRPTGEAAHRGGLLVLRYRLPAVANEDTRSTEDLWKDLCNQQRRLATSLQAAGQLHPLQSLRLPSRVLELEQPWRHLGVGLLEVGNDLGHAPVGLEDIASVALDAVEQPKDRVGGSLPLQQHWMTITLMAN